MAIFPFKNVIFMMQNHLSLSTSTTQLSVSAPASSSSSFTVNYLTNSCGLPLKSAIATSRKLRGFDENNLPRYDSVIHLFKSHGFHTAHISKIIHKYPNLLNEYKVEENLKPKFEYLAENGFSGPLLRELIVSNPQILGTSLSDHLKPSLDYLRSFLGTEERLKLALKRSSRLLSNNLKATLLPNIDLLLKEGVPLDALRNFLVSHPYLMQPKVDRLVSALKIVKDVLNMRPTDPKFLLAVTRMASIGVPLWEKKLQVFNSLGFSQEEALSIFKRSPGCFSRSEETLRTKLGFYLNTVKLKRGDIITYPALLGYGIETRIRPRHNVLKLLLSKKLLKEDAKIARILTLSEDKFLSKYVIEHLQQLPSLLEMYNNKNNNSQLSVSASASAAAASSSSTSKDFTVDYLTNKCGFLLKSAIATSPKLRGFDENNLQRSDAVISLFESHGFDTANIAKMIEKRPELLTNYKVEENLKPKIEFLVQSGFSGPHLHHLMVSNPKILIASLSLRIKPSLDSLRSLFGTDERLKLSMKRDSRLLTINMKATLLPNINLLVKEGVPVDALTKFLVSRPSLMIQKVDRLVSALKIVKDILNMRPTDPLFLLAVMRMASMGVPLWEEKLQAFKSFGFSQQQAFCIFQCNPDCFGLSEKNIRTKLDFYLNTVKLKRGDIISYSALLNFALETRIGPRHNVLKLLLSKNLLQEDAKIAYLLAMSEKKFLSKCVNEHLQQLPSLLEMYNNSKDKAVKEDWYYVIEQQTNI